MQKYLYFLIGLFISSLTSGLTATEKPNVVFIFVDSLGWKDMDVIAVSSLKHLISISLLSRMRLRTLCAGAVCSPTRCAVQSGQNGG